MRWPSFLSPPPPPRRIQPRACPSSISADEFQPSLLLLLPLSLLSLSSHAPSRLSLSARSGRDPGLSGSLCGDTRARLSYLSAPCKRAQIIVRERTRPRPHPPLPRPPGDGAAADAWACASNRPNGDVQVALLAVSSVGAISIGRSAKSVARREFTSAP